MPVLQLNSTAVQDRSGFVSKVYTTLAVSLLFACLGAYLGFSMPLSLFWPMVIAEFVVLLACLFLQRAYPINLFLLFAFTSLSGITLGPMLNAYVTQGMGNLIPVATGATALTFGSLSAYVHISKKDFSFLGGFLFMGLIAMLAVGILGFFFRLPIPTTLYSGFGVLLFSGYILYDTSLMLRRYQDNEFVAATLGLYLDIINLFINILRLLGGQRR